LPERASHESVNDSTIDVTLNLDLRVFSCSARVDIVLMTVADAKRKSASNAIHRYTSSWVYTKTVHGLHVQFITIAVLMVLIKQRSFFDLPILNHVKRLKSLKQKTLPTNTI